jgi:hypothetical protein
MTNRICNKEIAMLRSFKVLLAVFAVIVIAGSAYAFAGANTVTTPSKAGEGSATISGYTITNILYTFNATDPTKIDKVTLTTSAHATFVKIKLVADTGTWFTCADTDLVEPYDGTSWTCNTSAAPTGTVALMTQISVFATDQTALAP